jgi:hypothetical protein
LQIHCRYCAAEIPAGNINLDKLMAKCANCSAVFSIAGELGLAAGEKKSSKRVMSSVPMPKYVSLEESFGELKILRKWFSMYQAPLVFFAVIWNGFLLFWYTIALSTGQTQMALFGLLHLAAGLFLIYTVATNFINATLITVNPQTLDIKHGPIPAWGNKTLNPSDIAQIYCKEIITRSRRSQTITYEVAAIMHDQRRETLLTGLYNAEQALYIEQEVERFLGIANEDVPGEMRKY